MESATHSAPPTGREGSALPSPHMWMTRLLLVLMAAMTVLALGLGCSSSSGPSGSDGDDDDDLPPGGPVYVDPDYSGEELGTKDKPFNTIAEGISAARAGWTVMLAAGAYSRPTFVNVPKVLTFRGAGRDSTVLAAGFTVNAGEDTAAVTFKHLSCVEVTHWVSRFNWETPARDSTRAPIFVDSCSVDTVRVWYPPNHSYTITNCTIGSGVVFAHGDVYGAAENVVRGCTIGGGAYYTHGGGDVTNVLEDCTMGGPIVLRQGDGSTNTISGNMCTGIVDRSGDCETTISNNVLTSGDLIDKSGGWGTESQFIEWNHVVDGVIILRSGSVTCRYNTVSAPAETFAIEVNSGPPSNIVGNTLTLPYGVPIGPEPAEWKSVGIRASCGEGVIQDNVITGGSLGLLDASGATEISGNVVSEAHVGVYVGYSNGKELANNSIQDCVSDAVVVANRAACTAPCSFSGNVVTGNGGAGFRVQYPLDLGGGTQGSTGGNVLTGNGDYDLYVEIPVGDAAKVYARHNTWDHATEGDVDAHDIYDANDDGSLSDVDFMPLAGGGGAW